MASYSNLVELLLERASTQPTDRAYTFLSDGETEGRVLTYGELESSTRAVAVALSEQVRPGDRVLLHPPGLDFIVAFLACQLAGAVAVPVYPPRKPEEWPRFAAIATDCSAAAVCTLSEHAPILKMGLDSTPALAHVALVASDTVDAAAADRWRMPAITPESLAFLQYTSGSTGVPKGVMVSHANLLHNESIIQQGFGNDASLVVVSWLPQYHDMGLIGGILQPLFLGGHSILMSPFAFLQQPMRWLQAISRYRAMVSGAPNFAYALCASRATDEIVAGLDLSSWRLAFNGAEPIRLATLERFAERFAPAGFRREGFFPCYGLAEGTLYVTGAPRGRFPRALHVDAGELERHALVPSDEGAPGSRALVGCGSTIEQTVRIVDPHSLEACAPGRIGEIWVQGPSVARGYWNRPDATRDTFDAKIAGSGDGPFLRTGDLGVLHEGELFVTGRLKELIIVDGRNHYPQDIEETVQTGRSALRSGCGAAFSMDVEGTERLVVVQEVVKGGAGADLERLAAEIRASVAAKHGIGIHALVFIQERGVQKTSSGKIRRGVMRDRFRDGKLDVVLASVGASPVRAPARPAEKAESPAPASSRKTSSSETERLIASLIAPKVGLGAAEIDVEASFSSFGLDSRALVGLSGELETALGRRLEPQIFYNYASIAALARFLAGDDASVRAERASSAVAGDAIAIVGMACRFPGAPDLDAFWDLLQSGRDAITEVPSGRWDIASWFDADPSAPGKMATRWGGFIDGVDAFDADFFGTSPREAEAMDPQQRLMLQLAWHALEDGGIRPESLRGSRTGVFVGISGNDYARLQAGTTGLLSAHAGTGNALSIVANRISYFMDLRGPSLAIDTACSSSLTAIHTAAVHLKTGECDAALVGGINLLLAPDATVSFSQNRMMAADGRCKTFSKDADGYVRAEGGGVVVLKRLADAIAAGDRIWAVISGSACNQDGRSNGLTAPNGLAQQAVLRDALEQAGWAPSDVQLVETHGTGTRLGDPIEAEALGAVYGKGRDPQAPLVLGAVKSQIGHLEAAAGMAGLIKTALCLTHETIVGNLHCRETNPLVRADEWRLSLPRETAAWPRAVRRRAGVSAFGFGGTNAHVLLEAAPPAPVTEAPATKPERPIHLLAIAAKNERVLAELEGAHAARLSVEGADVAAHCHTTNTTRSHFREARRVVSGKGAAELVAALGNRNDAERFVPSKRGVAFLFTGQGAQYVQMGRALYEAHPTFRAILDECDRALEGTRALGLLELLYPPADKEAAMDALLANTEYTQPALFALEYALAKLWLSWGVRPAAVMGHSLGEIVAAAIAGVFSLADALKLVEARGRLMRELPEHGGMLAVFAHERDLEELLPRFAGRLAIGAFNGPGQMVLSGALRELEKARHVLKQRGIEAKPLKVSHAFHSPLMEPMLAEFRQVAESLTYARPSIPIVSNLTGQPETERLATAAYWVEHVVAPVRFAHGVEALKKLDVGILLEIGPRPVLLGMARRMLPASAYLFQPSLDAGKDDWQRLAASVGALYEAGVSIDWAAFDAPFACGGAQRASAVPLYPFAKKPFWFEVKSIGTSDARGQNGAHPLLGRALSSPRLKSGEKHFESRIRLPGPAFLRAPVEPAERRVSLLAYLEMALEAQRHLFADNPRSTTDLRLEGLLQVQRDESRTVQTICEPTGDGEFRMEVWADEGEDRWRRVATGNLGAAAEAPEIEPFAALRARIVEPLDVDTWYETTRESGLQYCMSPYPAIRHMWWAPSEVLAEVTPREEDDVVSRDIWLKHCVWNACNQALGALCPRDGHGTYFPVSLRSARFFRTPGRSLVLHGVLREHETDGPSCVVDVVAYDEDGTPVARIEGVRLVPDEAVLTARAEWRRTAPEARPEVLRAALRRVVARAFKRSPEEIPLKQPLTMLGLDSLTAMDIATRAEQTFEAVIELSSLQQGACIEDLAVALEKRLAEAEGWTARSQASSSPLVELNQGDASHSPLFLLHPTGGTVFCYQELARHLGSRPLVAVQSPALAFGASDFDSLEAMAAHHLAAIKQRQAAGPYRLGGWSMGGVLAFEIARQLEASGEEVESLVLIDALAPGELPKEPSRAYALLLFTRSLGIDLGTLTEHDLQGDLDATLDLILGLGRGQVHALRSMAYGDFRRLLTEFERNLSLLGGYQAQPYKGTATVLRAETPLVADRPEASGRDWEKWVAGFDALHTVPGDHFGLLSGSHLVLTASYVRKALNALGGRGGESREGGSPLSLAYERAPANVVIGDVARDQDGFVRSRLVVDEAHPYFFDHPLDHVSGILMVEGMLQLLEAGGLTRHRFMRHMRLTFPRFCEKDRPVTLELAPTTDADTRTCRAMQEGLPVCTLKFHADALPVPSSHRAPSPAVAPADAKLLHKARAGNVLVGQWSVSGGVAEATLIAPSAGHLLAEGDVAHYSPLYLLETVRQLVTGLAHSSYAVPLGMPMNLVGVELGLEAPLARGTAITLRHTLKPLAAPGAATFAHFDVDVLAGREVIGNCRLTAQLLTKEAYLRVRNRRHRAVAA